MAMAISEHNLFHLAGVSLVHRRVEFVLQFPFTAWFVRTRFAP
jgi:hypothetical protein